MCSSEIKRSAGARWLAGLKRSSRIKNFPRQNAESWCDWGEGRRQSNFSPRTLRRNTCESTRIIRRDLTCTSSRAKLCHTLWRMGDKSRDLLFLGALLKHNKQVSRLLRMIRLRTILLARNDRVFETLKLKAPSFPTGLLRQSCFVGQN